MKEHEDKIVIKFCIECKIYMCHQCYNHHKALFNDNHHLLEITDNMDEIFTGFCKEENHQSNKLDHFCKTHNKLCCICCIGNNSEHKNCNICKIEEIKEEKKNNLENNIKILENILKDIKDTMNKNEKN